MQEAAQENLRSAGFAFHAGDELPIPGELASRSDALALEWDNLEPDNYLRDGATFRERRYGRYAFQPSTERIVLLAHKPYLQSKATNSYAGGIERVVAPVTASINSNPVLSLLIKHDFKCFPAHAFPPDDWWLVACHMFRIIGRSNELGEPTPEGVHRDDIDFGAMHLMKRENALGGLSRIHNEDRSIKAELCLSARSIRCIGPTGRSCIPLRRSRPPTATGRRCATSSFSASRTRQISWNEREFDHDNSGTERQDHIRAARHRLPGDRLHRLGSTYLAIAYALESFPPLLMAATRFLTAGLTMVLFLALRGHPLPSLKELGGAAVVGTSMLGLGVGSIGIAEQTISSGMASIGIATVPIWAVLLAGLLLREWPNRWEMAGIALGFVGVVFLNVEGSLNGAASGALIIVGAALFWGLGSVLSRVVPLPTGPTAYAYEMLTGGIALSIAAFALGERMTVWPTTEAFAGWLYLVIGGSFFAYTAYMYLLQQVRTSVATSYAFVTPVVAILLGVHFLEESVSRFTILAVVSVLLGVWCIFRGREDKNKA
ncbi:2OG-Fe dioxygenase family protein [Breoghania sp. L-A4]|uniref:2OG-Fe dioxygenase family protein n=1 Tax=Breoghania sp. L-A4 TaxID=2304600 RepID=UPI000E35CFA7|nr:2OG-Fe dioxygenase family protein [Breoghania sp. L-A4]AXS39944.1 hypothetical protein D1F64_07580 [Breoghania sp. L-A4]